MFVPIPSPCPVGRCDDVFRAKSANYYLTTAPLLSLSPWQANFMRKPNIIVHLDVSPEESLRRIHLRLVLYC